MNDEPVCLGKSEAKKRGWAKLKMDSKALEETILLCGKCQEERVARDAKLKERIEKINGLAWHFEQCAERTQILFVCDEIKSLLLEDKEEKTK